VTSDKHQHHTLGEWIFCPHSSSLGARLQLGKDSVDARDSDFLAGFIFGVDDLAVVDDDGVAAGSGTERPADAAAELGLVIGQEEDGLVLDAVGLAPGGHDEGVVEGDDGDGIDALGLDLLELGDEA